MTPYQKKTFYNLEEDRRVRNQAIIDDLVEDIECNIAFSKFEESIAKLAKISAQLQQSLEKDNNDHD